MMLDDLVDPMESQVLISIRGRQESQAQRDAV